MWIIQNKYCLVFQPMKSKEIPLVTLLTRMHFPALGTGCMALSRALIGFFFSRVPQLYN